jgi:hypothetical protein
LTCHPTGQRADRPPPNSRRNDEESKNTGTDTRPTSGDRDFDTHDMLSFLG